MHMYNVKCYAFSCSNFLPSFLVTGKGDPGPLRIHRFDELDRSVLFECAVHYIFAIYIPFLADVGQKQIHQLIKSILFYLGTVEGFNKFPITDYLNTR